MELREVSGHLVQTDPTRPVGEKNKTEVIMVDRDQEPEQFKQAFPSWREGIWSSSYQG